MNLYKYAYTHIFHVHVLVLYYTVDQQYIPMCVLKIVNVVPKINTIITYKLGSVAPNKSVDYNTGL